MRNAVPNKKNSYFVFLISSKINSTLRNEGNFLKIKYSCWKYLAIYFLELKKVLSKFYSLNLSSLLIALNNIEIKELTLFGLIGFTPT